MTEPTDQTEKDITRLLALAETLPGTDRRLEPAVALAVEELEIEINNGGAEDQIRFLIAQGQAPEQIEAALRDPDPDFDYSEPLDDEDER